MPFCRYVWNQQNPGTGLRFEEIVTAEGKLNLLPDINSEIVTDAGIVVSDSRGIHLRKVSPLPFACLNLPQKKIRPKHSE